MNRGIYWIDKEILIISDFHNGKSTHFRKNGIAISNAPSINDFRRLELLIKEFDPKALYVLGDLSHSKINSEWDELVNFRSKFSKTEFYLIPGNHDRLSSKDYELAGIQCLNNEVILEGITLVHDFETLKANCKFSISGHIHPAVILRGKVGQSLRTPCFYMNEKQLILPAFSEFTGSFKIRPKKGDKVIACLKKGLLAKS